MAGSSSNPQNPFAWQIKTGGLTPGWGTSSTEFVSEGAPTPSNSSIKKKLDAGSVGRYAALEKAAKDYQAKGGKLSEFGLVKKGSGKGDTGGGTGGGAGGTNQKFLADMLYGDPTSQFSPAIKYLAQQETNMRDRYAQNQANLQSIFGALSGLSAKDAARINEQFTQSITEQQQALAARTAEARAGSAAGVAQAQATGAERGAGPGMAVNPLQTAVEEGISGAKTAQQQWEGLMSANQAQAVQDAATRQTGFGYQQAQALQDLQGSLEGNLLGLAGSRAQVEGDLAGAKYQAQQQVREAKYSEAMAAAERSRQAAAAAAAAKNTYSKGIAGIQEKAVKQGINFNSLQSGLSEAYDAAFAKLNPDGGATRAVQKPGRTEIMAAWSQFNPNSAGSIGLANDLAVLLYPTR